LRRRIVVGLLLFCLTILAIGGCASKPTVPDSSQNVSIASSFKQLGIGSNVTRVVLEISGSGFATMTQDLSIANGIVRAEVEVPFGTDRVFALTAYAGQTRLYYGADTADVSASSVTEVSIYMQPQVPMIKITPSYNSISSVGLDGTVRVEVYNIDSLFGISLRLEADSSIIGFLSAEVGGFLVPSDSTLFSAWVFPHYVAIGYTLEGDRQPKGISGSGLIATIAFVAKRIGTSALTLNPAYLRLIDWQGNTLPRQGQVYIENGEVEILGS
jgi:hypothetical protein